MLHREDLFVVFKLTSVFCFLEKRTGVHVSSQISLISVIITILSQPLCPVIWFCFFFLVSGRTELVWYLNRLSFLLKPSCISYLVVFFFPSRKRRWVKKKTYTLGWDFNSQELCLQHSVALHYYHLIVNIYICLLTLIFLGDCMWW